MQKTNFIAANASVGLQKRHFYGQNRDIHTARRRVAPSPLAVLRTPEILVEELDGALPRQLGIGLVVPGRGVVMESVIGSLIHVSFIGHVVRF